jgi:hypothetical protein
MSHFSFLIAMVLTSSLVYAANGPAVNMMTSTEKTKGVELAKKVTTRADAVNLVKSGEDEFQSLEDAQKSMLMIAGDVAELFKKSSENIKMLSEMAAKGTLTQSQLLVAVNQIQSENRVNVEKYKIAQARMVSEHQRFKVLSQSIKAKSESLKNSIPGLQ